MLSVGAIGTEAPEFSAKGGTGEASSDGVISVSPEEGGGTDTSSATTDGSSVVTSELVGMIAGSSFTCSMTAGMIGGKYPSFLCVPRLGDMVNGAVSLRLVGRPLIIPLVRVLNGGSTGRTDDPMTDVGDVS